jgi:hypothetical protein
MDISQNSCHPFQFGRYLFMHNGLVGGFKQVRCRRCCCRRRWHNRVTHGNPTPVSAHPPPRTPPALPTLAPRAPGLPRDMPTRRRAERRQIRRELMRGLTDRAFDYAMAHGASDSAVAFAIFIDLLEDPRGLASIPVSALCDKLVLGERKKETPPHYAGLGPAPCQTAFTGAQSPPAVFSMPVGGRLTKGPGTG